MKISVIAAVAANRAIGRKGGLLYRLPDDLKRFKALTTGHSVIMGRKTFDSLPNGPLPNRRNIVVSGSVAEIPGAEVYNSLQGALDACNGEEEVFVIGGGQVYKLAMPLADKLCLTEIDDTPAGADTFFPDYSGWVETSSEPHPTDERHSVAFRFADYRRP